MSDVEPGRFRQRGLTLIELMIVIVIAAILLTVAIPGMRDLIARNSLAGKLNELVGAMQVARSESISRNAMVTACRSADGASCGGAGWHVGWIVFADIDGDGAVETGDGDIVLQKSAAPSSDFTVSGTNSFTYRPDGRVAASGALTVCRLTHIRGTVTVEASGRASGKKEPDTTGCS